MMEEPKPQVEPVKLQVEPLRPPVEKPVAEKLPEPIVKPVRPVERPEPQPRPVQPRLRPKAVQVHDGRVEISLPYTIGVTVLLVGRPARARRLSAWADAAPVPPAGSK